MSTPQLLKCFCRGRLEFGNEKTLEKVKQHFTNRVESLYKADVFYNLENHFLEDLYSIELSRDTMQLSDKTYRKSVELLRELAQYSLAGRIKCWAIDSGTIVHEDVILPKNDKDAVVTYTEALNLSALPGNEIKAIELINQSLDSFDRNPLAYDRRGFISYKLGKITDAIIDFEKSIALFKDNPEPHYGLGRCFFERKEWAKVRDHMTAAMKASIPRESIYHTARLYNGIALFHLGEIEAAKLELEAFVTRKYAEDDHNHKKLHLAYKFLGKIHLNLSNDLLSHDYFNMSMALAHKHNKNVDQQDTPIGSQISDVSEHLITIQSKKGLTSNA